MVSNDILVPLFIGAWCAFFAFSVIRGRRRRAKLAEVEGTTSSPPAPHAVPAGDPVAAKTGWDPASGGGQSFRGHRLVQVDPTRLEFRGTLGGKLFSLTFLLIGLLAAGAAVYHNTVGPVSGMKSSGGLFLFGLVFAGVGVLVFPAAIVFDRRLNLFRKRKVVPVGRGDGGPRGADVQLDAIYAIQILSELIRGDKRSYHSHELNLVLNDGSRVNVVDQGGLETLREEADTLSRFLGKPVWEK